MPRSRVRNRAVVLAPLLIASSLLWVLTATPAPAALSASPCLTSYGSVEKVNDVAFDGAGNLWFVQQAPALVGRRTPDGRITHFGGGLDFRDILQSIVAGPDGNMWFTSSNNRVGRVTPDGVVTLFRDGITPGNPATGVFLGDIVVGPDGNLWFTEVLNPALGRITPAGVITEFPFGSGESGAIALTVGPDNNIWYARQGTIGHMNTDGTNVVEFTEGIADNNQDGSPKSSPASLVTGPDGNLWYARGGANKIGKLTVTGSVTEYDMPRPAHTSGELQAVTDLTVGPDGNIWMTELFGGFLAKIKPADGSVVLLSDGLTVSVEGRLISIGPVGITTGPDGNLWYGENLAIDPERPHAQIGLGRITPTGTVTHFGSFPTALALTDATAGTDGNVWYTKAVVVGGPINGFGAAVGRVTPDGRSTEFFTGLTDQVSPLNITAGPDGNMWFTETNDTDADAIGGIGRVTPAGVITEFRSGISPGSVPFGITAGPDGNLWFTENGGDRIGRITTAGVVTEFSAGITPDSQPTGITAGPDGNVWFTERAAGRIGRITPTGVVTEFPIPDGPLGAATPVSITAGPDGNLWFVDVGSRIGRITPNGVITMFRVRKTVQGTTFPVTLDDIVNADGVLWFSTAQGGSIGRLTTTGTYKLVNTHAPNTPELGFENPFVPLSRPKALAVGERGSIWFVDANFITKIGHAYQRDAVGAPCNQDEDDDGLLDTRDPRPLDPDADDDGVGDGTDNCVLQANADQANGDDDTIGDACERIAVLRIGTPAGRHVKARLRNVADQPIAGARIVFRARDGRAMCNDRTGPDGWAGCDSAIALPAGGYRAIFAGDANYDPASDRTGS